MFHAVFTSFSPYLGIGRTGGGGSPKGWVHNLRLQFFTLGSSKIKVFETYLSDTVITYNDHPSYVKHVSGRIYVFFTLFGRRGGGQTGLVHNLLMQFFSLYSSKIEVFETFYLIL